MGLNVEVLSRKHIQVRRKYIQVHRKYIQVDNHEYLVDLRVWVLLCRSCNPLTPASSFLLYKSLVQNYKVNEKCLWQTRQILELNVAVLGSHWSSCLFIHRQFTGNVEI